MLLLPTCPQRAPNSTMTHVHNFCVDLTCGGYSFKEINEAVERSFGVKAISRSAIYKILAKTKAGKDASDKRTGGIRTVRTTDLEEAIRQFVSTLITSAVSSLCS